MMSDDILSQEEIEALLNGGSLASSSEDSTSAQELTTEHYLSDLEQDTLGEVGNISFGSSATALSTLLGQKVEITTPTISIVDNAKLEEEFIQPYVAVRVEYTAGLSGMNLLVIKQKDAAIIADLMLGGDGTAPNEELGDIHLSAVQEAMNQMMGSAATSMSTMLNKKVDISPPTIELMDIQSDTGTQNIPADDLIIKVAFSLQVGTLIDSEIMQLVPLEFGKGLVSSLVGGDLEDESAAAVAEMPTFTDPEPESERLAQQPHVEETLPKQPAQKTTYEKPSPPPKPEVQVQQAQFASFDNPILGKTESKNLDMLFDIPLQVTVELGRTKRSVKEILEMSSGSIIELDKLAGEPVDILVNERLIAKGEVVVIDENFGVRISDILNQADRLNHLR